MEEYFLKSLWHHPLLSDISLIPMWQALRALSQVHCIFNYCNVPMARNQQFYPVMSEKRTRTLLPSKQPCENPQLPLALQAWGMAPKTPLICFSEPASLSNGYLPKWSANCEKFQLYGWGLCFSPNARSTLRNPAFKFYHSVFRIATLAQMRQ